MPPGEKQKDLHALEARTRSAITRRRPQGRTIQDMPVELLLEIFHILAIHSKDIRLPTAWMRVLLVCRYWYRVACDASELWRVIHVGSNGDWLQLCLERSVRSLVDLHFSGLPTATVEAAVPLVVPHAQRIRAIHFTGCGWLAADMCAFIGLFRHAFPALEELSILPAEWRAPREANIISWGQGYRALHSLALSGVSIPRDPTFYRKMRTLELHERCCEDNMFTFDDLILSLNAAASTLEELNLSRFEPVIPQEPVPQSTSRRLPNVHLERLRDFYMESEFPLVSRLNKHLSLPRGAFLHLRVLLTHTDQMAYANGTTMLADIVPPGLRHVLDDVTELAVYIVRDSYSIRVPNIPSNAPPSRPANASRDGDLLIPRVAIDTFGWSSGRGPGLRGVLTVYTAGLLTSLSIRLAGSEYPASEWRTLLGAFRMLENLAIVDDARLDCATDAFVALSASAPGTVLTSSDGGNQTRPSGSADVLCPSLRVLRVEGVVQKYQVEAFFSSLCETLRSRAAAGLRLEELRVDCFRTSGIVPYSGAQEDALRLLVGSLVLR